MKGQFKMFDDMHDSDGVGLKFLNESELKDIASRYDNFTYVEAKKAERRMQNRLSYLLIAFLLLLVMAVIHLRMIEDISFPVACITCIGLMFAAMHELTKINHN